MSRKKRDALVKWSGHLTGAPPEAAPPMALNDDAALTVERLENLEAARIRALALCAGGRSQQAVVAMCMAASRHGSVSQTHLDLLGTVGLDLASRNDWSELENWIIGFG